MKRLGGWLFLLAIATSAGCYSHTKEVVVEQRVPVPSNCKFAVWIPATVDSPGYWSCSS